MPGTAYCDKHTEINRQKYHAKVTGAADATAYQLLTANGICPACKKAPASADSVYCPDCLHRQRLRQFQVAAKRKDIEEETDAILIAKRKAEGVCIDCDAIEVFENDRCRFCQAAWLRRHENLTTYASRLRVGLCQRCPAVVPVGTVCCPSCQTGRHAATSKKHNQKICISCPNPTDGKHKCCSDCRAEKRQNYHRQKVAGICTAPSCTQPNNGKTSMCEKHRKESNERCEKKHAKLRAEVLAAYGSKCNCPGGCNETIPEFLSVDHIANDGAAHRRELNIHSGVKFYYWLKKNGFPRDNFQLLCTNCNSAKYRNGGECPHVTRARAAGKLPADPCHNK